MAGNKHKNGIVCMYPGCEKKMRTQKFKGHFIKMHLKEGEEYSVEHRRQFEVAQADPLSDAESASSASVAIDTAMVDRMKEETLTLAKRGAIELAKKTAEVASAVAAAAATAAAIGAVVDAPPTHEDSDTASESASPVPQHYTSPSSGQRDAQRRHPTSACGCTSSDVPRLASSARPSP
ncbi:hypothetical protein PINS_up021575 [Pythium insidiosum]|nr:hypothetical protein PINS_up021575 [Pythium insidiosum]